MSEARHISKDKLPRNKSVIELWHTLTTNPRIQKTTFGASHSVCSCCMVSSHCMQPALKKVSCATNPSSPKEHPHFHPAYHPTKALQDKKNYKTFILSEENSNC